MTFSYLLIYREIDFTYYDIARIAKAVQSHSYFQSQIVDKAAIHFPCLFVCLWLAHSLFW